MTWLFFNDCLWWFAAHVPAADLMAAAFGLLEC